MSERIDLLFFGLVCAGALWLVLLWAGARFKIGRRGPIAKAVFGVATVLLLLMPAGGLPLWSWAFSFCPNPSLPMLGMICAALWQHLGGVAVLKPADWRATWIFGACAGTIMYLHPWFLGAFDLYYWGWHQDVAVWALAAAAVLFLAWGNRLGVLLLGALIAYKLEALESRNCWDYVIDPIYWLISLGLGGADALRAWRARRGRRGASLVMTAPVR